MLPYRSEERRLGGNELIGRHGLRGVLTEVYERLFRRFGAQGWWPADDDFEMVVGAILTQSTAWANVEKAIANLRAGDLLSADGIASSTEAELSEAVRPSGYFRQKALKLDALVAHLLRHHGGELDSLFHVKLPALREELLGIWGIGPETADSIVLYGARQPVFVVDAYTRRIFSRLGLVDPNSSYDQLQRLFMDHLEPSVPVFQEYHALIVALGKEICRPRPRCQDCPLLEICPTGRQNGRGPGASRREPARETLPDTIRPSDPHAHSPIG